MNNLKDKIVIVTGGSGLIGSGIVNKIRLEGAFCINAELNADTSDDLAQAKCDITSPEAVSELIEKVMKKYGRIDGLVNNAYPRTKDWGTKFEDIPYESWQKNVDWQMNSYFLFCAE